jgi:hypothetical protein
VSDHSTIYRTFRSDTIDVACLCAQLTLLAGELAAHGLPRAAVTRLLDAHAIITQLGEQPAS